MDSYVYTGCSHVIQFYTLKTDKCLSNLSRCWWDASACQYYLALMYNTGFQGLWQQQRWYCNLQRLWVLLAHVVPSALMFAQSPQPRHWAMPCKSMKLPWDVGQWKQLDLYPASCFTSLMILGSWNSTGKKHSIIWPTLWQYHNMPFYIFPSTGNCPAGCNWTAPGPPHGHGFWCWAHHHYSVQDTTFTRPPSVSLES